MTEAYSRPTSALSVWGQTHGYPRPTSAVSAAGPTPNRSPSPGFRPASAASNTTFVSTASHLRDTVASKYTPTVSQQVYDLNPPVGIFRYQLKKNGWFLKNQRAPSQLRIGKPICKEIPVSKSLLLPQGLPCAQSQTYGSRPTSGMRPPTAELVLGSSSISRRLRGQVHLTRSNSAVSRAGTEARRQPERLPFGAIEEDNISMVEDLTNWAPPQQDAKPESLPSHYRTTTKHGSTAHTIWDFIWETPVARSERIKNEIQLPESF